MELPPIALVAPGSHLATRKGHTLKRTLLVLASAGLLFAIGPAIARPSIATSPRVAAETATSGARWYTSWDEAAKESQRSGKPIMMDFTGSDWCGWCMKLKSEVFDTPYFQQWAADKVVLLEVDFPRNKPLPEAQAAKNEELAAKYQVEGFPTIVFTDHTGEQLGTAGYQEGGPELWTRNAEAGWQR
jgi:protein disulfide-isomerase